MELKIFHRVIMTISELLALTVCLLIFAYARK